MRPQIKLLCFLPQVSAKLFLILGRLEKWKAFSNPLVILLPDCAVGFVASWFSLLSESASFSSTLELSPCHEQQVFVRFCYYCKFCYKLSLENIIAVSTSLLLHGRAQAVFVLFGEDIAVSSLFVLVKT